MKYLYELKLKDCERVFKEGMNPGVLIQRTVEFDMGKMSLGMLAAALLDEEGRFLRRHIEVVITPQKEQGE